MNYFERKNAEANEEYLEMAGWQEGFADEDDMDFGADAWDDFDAQENLNASGNSKPAQSQPYVIELENTTTDDVSSVVFLDAANNTRTSGISYTYGLDNLSYQQFLSLLAGNGLVFKVGQTRMVGYNSSSSATAEIQVLERVKCETVDPNNNKVSRTFIPQYDNYQQIKSQTDIWDEYFVNGLTAMTISKVYAGTKVTVYLYPASKTNEFKQIKSGTTTKYGNPRVNPSLARRR